MNDVTRILSAIEQGDSKAAEQLLPLVYDELRKLAARRLAHEKPGQTLEPTALVNEAYLRLVGPSDERRWESQGHFFAASAAEPLRTYLGPMPAARGKAHSRECADANTRNSMTSAQTGRQMSSWRCTRRWRNLHSTIHSRRSSSNCASSLV